MDAKKTGSWDSKTSQEKTESYDDEDLRASLGILLKKMSNVEKSLENINHLISRTPAMMSVATETLDPSFKEAQSKGLDLDSRLENLLHLATRISDSGSIEKLEKVLTLLDKAPGMTAAAVDTLDAEVAILQTKNIDLHERMSSILGLIEKLSEPKVITQIEGLLNLSSRLPDSLAMLGDMFDEEMMVAIDKGIDPEALVTLGSKAALAVSETVHMEPEIPGNIFSLLKRLRDPDRQKALGFLLNFLKNLGQKL